MGSNSDPDSLPSEIHLLPANSAWSHSTIVSQPHASASPTQVPVVPAIPQMQPQIPPPVSAGMYPTANWQAPTPQWPTGTSLNRTSLNPFPCAAPYWNPYSIGPFQQQPPPPPPLESFLQDFAAALVDKMLPMLHKQTDDAEPVPPVRLPSETGTTAGSEGQMNTDIHNHLRGVNSLRDTWSSASSETASRTSSCLSEPLPMERSMGGTVSIEYHDNTYIPPSVDTFKPRAPPRDPSGDIDTFTDEEKIFFIQFLRWRLREGPLPPKLVLCWELGQEAPHHDHLSWKRHWDSHPFMPDQIYIEARTRCERETATKSSASRTASPPVMLRLSDTRSDPRDIHPWTHRSKHGRHPVTDEDVKAMALYMVEKRRVWNKFKSHSECWREFADRPQNRERRNFNAWNCAARQNADRILDAYNELMGWDEDYDGRGSLAGRRGPSPTTMPFQHQPRVYQPQPVASGSTSTTSTAANQGD